MECTLGYVGGRGGGGWRTMGDERFCKKGERCLGYGAGGKDFAKNDQTEIKGVYEQVAGGWASGGVRAEMTLAFRGIAKLFYPTR